MPIVYSTCLERNFLFMRLSGYIDFGQILAGRRAYPQDCHYCPGRPELIDVSATSELDVNFGLVKSILREVNNLVPGMRLKTPTVIYSPNETVYGLGRMYQTLADLAGGIEMHVFMEEQEALAKLDLEYSSIEEMMAAETLHPYQPRSGDRLKTG